MFKKNYQERRRFKRISFGKKVEIIGGDGAQGSQLGLGGMFIQTPQEFPIGSLVPLRIHLSEQENKPLELHARVKNARQGLGVGVAFEDIPWELLRKLSDFLEGQ